MDFTVDYCVDIHYVQDEKNSAASPVPFCVLYEDDSSRRVNLKGVGETKLISSLYKASHRLLSEEEEYA